MKLLMNSIISIKFLALSLTFAYAETGVPVHYLKPPKLQQENLGARMRCYRPCRKVSTKIEIETINEKTVVHNYGHGGSGWTLAPGCVQHLVQQFNDTISAPKDASLVVIGAGVMGLMTAYMLIKLGYTKISVIAEQFDDLTSHKAGGFCAPINVPGKPINPSMNAFGLEAYRFYAAIARGENEDFDARGALFMRSYLMRDENRLSSYEGVVMNRPEEVLVDFGNGTTYEMKVYHDAIFMDTQRLMQSLTSLLENKVTFVQKKVDSFDEIEAFYVFNCAGLGAQDLAGDAAMTSAQGHLILLQNQDPETLNYMIGRQTGEEAVTEAGQVVKRSIYMFPKHVPGSPDSSVGVLGGTYIEGATDATPNEQEFEILVERMRGFFGGQEAS